VSPRLGCTLLFILGIIGEYLGRLYMESKRRTLFVIDTVYARDAKPMPHQPMAEAGRNLAG
jgi:hypothetical protein